MALIRLTDTHVSFGGPPILDGAELVIERGERVCLLGRNGSGKTTLMKVLAGELQPETGGLANPGKARIARLEQEVPEGVAGSIFDVTSGGLGETGRLLARYHHAGLTVAETPDDDAMKELEAAQHALDAAHGWEANRRVETALSRLKLDPDQPFAALSGGLKRRVMLARALASEPDLLLLDEPTNHLDIPSIQWMEAFLLDFSGGGGSILFITHDRQFLINLATRILELDRGQLTSWPGNYHAFVAGKEKALADEANQNAQFDKKLAQEEAWIRQGIKARRTRNEGRVRALQALRKERAARREVAGNVRITAQEADRSGKLVVEAEEVSYAWEKETVIRDFSTIIQRGDRVGIIGPNGSGKTTLLQLLLGKLTPDVGTIKLGTNIEVAYFDQLRAQLDEEKTVQENVGGGKTQLTIEGKNKHVISYLQDFLFNPERARSPVKVLSGGERNRLLLAKLFTRPSNVLVMDEPTNDLDVETLELLEERLMSYAGTLLLVSHDRAFLNNVVTSTLVFEEGGGLGDYPGGYDDWLAQRPVEEVAPKSALKRKKGKPKAEKVRKRSFKEKRELEELPPRIEALEGEQEELHQTMADPALYQEEGARVAQVKARLEAVEAELASAYLRWEELEAIPE